jgi:hypothetical protein
MFFENPELDMKSTIMLPLQIAQIKTIARLAVSSTAASSTTIFKKKK